MRADNSLEPEDKYRFGQFVLNLRERTLECDGRPVTISPKAWEVLRVLLENRGRVVEKRAIMEQVWPDAFVEENNLAFNISVLRKLLGEATAERKYIETIPKRGYRFAAQLPEPQQAAPEPPPHIAPLLLLWRRPGLLVLSGSILSAVVFLSALWPPIPRKIKASGLAEKNTILLADFANRTGDPAFDGTLLRGLAIELEQSPFLALIPEGRVRHTLELMGQPADTHLNTELTRDLCRRAGGTAVLQGLISRLGGNFVISLQANACGSASAIYQAQVAVTHREEALKAVTELAAGFRRWAGESPESLRQHNTPLSEATTPSLNALESYSLGWKLLGSTGAAAALSHFRRATDIDPDFAMAYAALGRVYSDLDDSDSALLNTRRAWELRRHTSDQEQFFIKANYDLFVTRNLEQARQTAELWSQTYPRLPNAHFLLSGIPNKISGNFEKAISEARIGLALDPDFAIGYYNLAVNHAYLNQYKQAEDYLQQGTARGLENDEMVMLRYELAFLRGDQSEMARQASRAHSRPGSETWMSLRQACVLMYSGHLEESRAILRQAIEEAHSASQNERAALWQAGAAVREGLLGNLREAARGASYALAISKNPDVKYGAALALALAGKVADSRSIADQLENGGDHDTSVRFNYLPVIRAQLALNQRNPAEAITALQLATPYETGIPQSVMSGLFGALYPVYLRGEAYLAARRGADAAGEFEKILQHRGIVVTDPVGALARLGSGRAWVMAGQLNKAKSAYEDFLELWKTADPDIPVLRQAKAEYRKLQGG